MINNNEIDFAMLEVAEDFWSEVERLAAKYEVTCDYILEEFYVD